MERENVCEDGHSMPDGEQFFTHIDTTADLYIYHPIYNYIDLVCAEMPSPNDSNVIFCAAASFTGKLLDHFEHTNILGPHVSSGVRYNGYDYNQNYGLFAATESTWFFATLPNDSLIDSVAAQGGMAFTQYWVIRDSVIYMPQVQKKDCNNIYRVIADLDGNLAIVESRRSVPYADFTRWLHTLPIRNALYLDMGAGWNYSFCRDQNDSIHIIHPHTHNFCTNWLTFYKSEIRN